MLRRCDGRRALAAAVVGRYRQAPWRWRPIRQYQFAQTHRDRIEVRLQTARPLSDDEARGVVDWAQAKFGNAFRIELGLSSGAVAYGVGKFEDSYPCCDHVRAGRRGTALGLVDLGVGQERPVRHQRAGGGDIDHSLAIGA